MSVVGQGIFTKLGMFVENGISRRVEQSNYASFENAKWRTTAILN